MRDQPDWWREMESNPIRPLCQTMSNWRARIDLQCSKRQSAITTTTKIIEAGGLGLQSACLASDGLSSFGKANVVFSPATCADVDSVADAASAFPNQQIQIVKELRRPGIKKPRLAQTNRGLFPTGRLALSAFRKIWKTLRS